MQIRPAERRDREGLQRLRVALWDDCLIEEVDAYFDEVPPRGMNFVAEDSSGLQGFLEVSAREFAEGCNTSPVAYVEGWYVVPELRGRGVGAALVQAAEEWARVRGMVEIASDSDENNADSFAAHHAVGFADVARIICYRKSLGGSDA